MKDQIIFTLTHLIRRKTFTYSLIILFTLYMIVNSIVNYQVEKHIKAEKLKQEISKLDEKKQKFIDSKEKEVKTLTIKQNELKQELDGIKSKINTINSCINGVNQTLGTKNRYSCTIKETPSVIPKASAEEEVKSELPTILLQPKDLFYTTKTSDKCSISQNEQQHFTKAGGYMLATDIACDFNKDGKGDQSEVYAPDYLNNSREYLIKKGKDNLLGDYIELYFDTEGGYEGKLKDTMGMSNAKWIIGHTTTNLKDGDIVKTGQRIGQSNKTGFTTGFHTHIELWTVINDKWKNISYTTRSEVLNNKRQGLLDTTVKLGEPIYFTSYNLGDVNQNDASPYIGASGKDLRYIKNPIALTVDIRKLYGIKFGDKIKMDGPCSGEYQVEDEMNIRFRTSCISKGACIKGDIAIQKYSKDFSCSGIYKIAKI